MNLRRGSLFIFLILRLCNYCFGIQEFQQSLRCCQKIFSFKVLSTLLSKKISIQLLVLAMFHIIFATLFPPRLSSSYVKIRIKVLSSKGDLKAKAE